DTAGVAPFLPPQGEAFAALLDTFLLDKALYELVYELNKRPDWVRIPLLGVLGLRRLPPGGPTLTTPALTDYDVYLFAEGAYTRGYERLGAPPEERDRRLGTRFAVWAPNARRVSVIGDFNGWKPDRDPLHPIRSSGIWEGFIPDVGPGALYKYAIT